jgi:hypothetical protein
MNHAIQGAIFCLHIRHNRCTTEVILTQALKIGGLFTKSVLKCTLVDMMST